MQVYRRDRVESLTNRTRLQSSLFISLWLIWHLAKNKTVIFSWNNNVSVFFYLVHGIRRNCHVYPIRYPRNDLSCVQRFDVHCSFANQLPYELSFIIFIFVFVLFSPLNIILYIIVTILLSTTTTTMVFITGNNNWNTQSIVRFRCGVQYHSFNNVYCHILYICDSFISILQTQTICQHMFKCLIICRGIFSPFWVMCNQPNCRISSHD